MSFVSHSYAICMSFVCQTYVLVCYSYVIQMLLECIRMSFVCYSYVLVCHLYVTRMYSYVFRMSLVCTLMSSICHSYVVLPWTFITCKCCLLTEQYCFGSDRIIKRFSINNLFFLSWRNLDRIFLNSVKMHYW